MIKFTQYLLPHGDTKEIFIERPQPIEAIADKLIEMGCHFDAEILTTGMISITCEKEDDLLSIQLCSNGPGVEDAVDKLITSAEASLKALLTKESE